MTQIELAEVVALTARIKYLLKLKKTKKRLNGVESYDKWVCVNRLEDLKVEIPIA